MNGPTLTRNLRIAQFLIGLGLAVLSACTNNQSFRNPPPQPTEQSQTAPQRTKVIRTKRRTDGQTILSSYSGSYALLIGESQYTHGWSKLTTIPGELQQVENLLTAKGFHVDKSLNLKADALGKRFETFINDYGFDKDNRLLFFYSGHGHTRNDKGYLVPTDAPTSHFDEKGFLQKALEMNQILTWARRIEAKHALFLFESCFSGKALPKMPHQISEAAKQPVRQFITAGTADETVHAKSVFTLAFVDALRFGWGDLYKDGYVTGEELGLYLKNKVPQHAYQTPQYGKIKDYDLSRGDFVFMVGAGRPQPVQPTVSAAVSVPPPAAPVLKPDSDRDGVTDDQDKCPRNSSKEISKGVDSSGCPLDKDRDGVADYRDACLGTTSGIKVQGNGCPVPAPVVSTHSSYRYTDNGDGTVTDNRSGLIWLKDANCFDRHNWEMAMQSAANLASGQCGLRDGSRRGMWRLPTEDEWEAMVDKKYVDRKNGSQPALSNAAGTGPWKEGDAFSGVQSDDYWSSSTPMFGFFTGEEWVVDLGDGGLYYGAKSYTDHSAKSYTRGVWPVRGGQ